MSSVRVVHDRLCALGDPEYARLLQRYFKTGPGEYGEGDRFVGLRVPQVRTLAKEYYSLPLDVTVELLRSPLHEARFLALLLLVRAYGRGDESARERIFGAYLDNTRFINNWDLVDASAGHIVGVHLRKRDRDRLHILAESEMLWERRIAVMATFPYIRQDEFDDTLRIAEFLLSDPEDLIHKAVGWMLREVGKRDLAVAESFLARHYRSMPRTMLRYSIEKFPDRRRRGYLRGEI